MREDDDQKLRSMLQAICLSMHALCWPFDRLLYNTVHICFRARRPKFPASAGDDGLRRLKCRFPPSRGRSITRTKQARTYDVQIFPVSRRSSCCVVVYTIKKHITARTGEGGIGKHSLAAIYVMHSRQASEVVCCHFSGLSLATDLLFCRPLMHNTFLCYH